MTSENLQNFYRERLRKNLHIVLCFSPDNRKFRERALKFPALISGCTIDWWKKQTSNFSLRSFGRFLQVSSLASGRTRRCFERLFDAFRYVDHDVEHSKKRHRTNGRNSRWRQSNLRNILRKISSSNFCHAEIFSFVRRRKKKQNATNDDIVFVVLFNRFNFIIKNNANISKKKNKKWKRALKNCSKRLNKFKK